MLQKGTVAAGKAGKVRNDKKDTFLFELKKNRTMFIMLIPAVVLVIVFSYIPLTGLIIAFKKFNYADGIFKSPWSGFDNFKYFFISGKAWLITRNTITFNLIFLVTNIFFEVLAAILIAEMSGKYFKKICQSFMFLPFFISWVIVATFAYNIFNYEFGLLNTFLKAIGTQPVDIYSMPGMWLILLPLFSMWKNVGYGSVVYLASIMGINSEMYEAAEIDGANIFKRIRHITIPQLIPTIIIMGLLALGRILRGNFDMFYQLVGTSANLYKYTDIIDTYVFRSMIEGSDFGMISAASFYQSVLCFLVIISANKLVKSVQKDYGLF